MKTLALIPLLLVLYACVPSTSEPGRDDHNMIRVIIPSDEMKAAEKSFAISEDKAYDLAVQYVKAANKPLVVDRSPLVIVGDDYVFGMPRKIGYPLRGYYVNGATGKVVYIDDPRVVEESGKITQFGSLK